MEVGKEGLIPYKFKAEDSPVLQKQLGLSAERNIELVTLVGETVTSAMNDEKEADVGKLMSSLSGKCYTPQELMYVLYILGSSLDRYVKRGGKNYTG